MNNEQLKQNCHSDRSGGICTVFCRCLDYARHDIL